MKFHHKIYKPRDMRKEVWRKWGVKVSYYVAWFAKEKIMEKINGNYERSYALGPSCAAQVLKHNPGSLATCANDADDGMFKHMCIAFGACIKGWIAGCRPILGLDGCHLKGKYGGVCLSIVSLDGNNGLFPLAIYLCRKENFECWQDFLLRMKPHLDRHPSKLTFMSDQQKGLDRVIDETFNNVNHRLCFRHLYKNFKKDVRGGKHLETLSWGAARAYRKSDCNKWMDNLKAIHQEAYDWLMKRQLVHFCRSQFDRTATCEHITNNFSESFNNFIMDLRDKTITGFVEEYCLLIMTHMRKRFNKARRMTPGDVVPRVAKTIEELKKEVNDFEYCNASDHRFVITLSIGGSARWEVDLKERTCECGQWQLTGIPCKHAVSLMEQRRMNIPSFCHELLTVNAYKRAYQNPVFPIPNDFEWDEPNYVVLPPPLHRPTGRPRGKRRRGEDEPVKSGAKVRRCKKCGSTQHTRATCKGLGREEIAARGEKTARRGRGRGLSKGPDPFTEKGKENKGKEKATTSATRGRGGRTSGGRTEGDRTGRGRGRGAAPLNLGN